MALPRALGAVMDLSEAVRRLKGGETREQKLARAECENAKRLGSCNRHDFKQLPHTTLCSCIRCRGLAQHSEVIWYERGLRDGSK
jgi:hypothetical protein